MAIYRHSIPPGGFHGYLRALAARCWGGSVPAPCAVARVPVVPPVTNLRAAPAPVAAVLGKLRRPQPRCGVPTPMPGPRGLVPAWGDAAGHHPKGSEAGNGRQRGGSVGRGCPGRPPRRALARLQRDAMRSPGGRGCPGHRVIPTDIPVPLGRDRYPIASRPWGRPRCARPRVAVCG